MLSIRIGTQFLDLFPDTSLNVSGVSPVFDRDRIERVFSYPVKVPVNENNQALLGYPSRLDAARQRRYEDVTVFLEGIEFDRGILKLTGVANDVIELSFQNAPLDIVEQMKRKKLRDDLNLTVSNATTAYRPSIFLEVDWSPPDTDFLLYIEINNTIYTRPANERDDLISDINAAWPGFASEFSDDPLGNWVMELDTSAAPSATIRLRPDIPPTTLTPLPFSVTIRDTIEEDEKVNEFITHVETVQSNADTHVFPPVYAPKFYDERGIYWENVVNRIDANGNYLAIAEPIVDDELWGDTFVPMPFLKYVMEELFNDIGLTLSGSFFDDSDIQKLIVYSTNALDIALGPGAYIEDDLTEVSTNNSFSSFRCFPPTYNLSDQLPDTTYYDFYSRLARTFPIIIGGVDRKEARIDDVDTLINQLSIDLTEFADPEYSLDISTTGGYRLTYDRQDTPEYDDNFLYDLEEIKDDLDPVEIETGFFSLYWKNLLDGDRVYRYPFEQGVGRSLLANVDEEVKFKLLFYEQDTDSEGNTYPYATFWQLARTGSVLGTYSLEWDRAYGLYDHWWRKLIELLSADELDVTVYLPLWKLIELRRNITAAIQIQYPEGKVIGYIKKYQFKIGLRTEQRIPVRLTLAKL